MAQAYDFKKVEEEISEFWKKKKIYSKAKKKGKKTFYFLDGPPYTSGRVHIGTAWNKSLKDAVLRYKRMKGFRVWDRAGYDMHGMPTEQGVEKEMGIRFKDEIPKIGVEKFVSACREFAVRNMNQMSADFQRLGVWMDFEHAYQPITREYIEGEWWLIKQAHKNGRLYEGEKTVHWCPKCGTALAKHELEYENVTEDSIFLKFEVVGKEKEFLVIWTTTPWTIPFNLGVMVNPNLDYIRAKVEDEVWILAKGLAPGVIQSVADKQYTVLEEFTGDKLQGLRYRHPLYEDIPEFRELESKSKKVFTVVLSEEYVDLSAGSGIVHMAPGCGPEDYEIGHREGIPPFNSLDEAGIFPQSMGRFAGLRAKKDDAKFIEALRERGSLIAITKVDHEYAHCWRCKRPVIFRTTNQWFFKVEDLKDTMRQLNKSVHWVPDFAGSKNFDSWLANLRDNGITRQRFWGTPLPVWRCDACSSYVVIGSIKELSKYSDSVPADLHKPWIDAVIWKCKKCQGTMKRVPDILDVWIDAGSASWNCLGFPQKKALFKKLFPADFILEGIDQIRGWFNLLLVASMVSMGRPSFKAVYMHGFVQDAKGRKMSKSLGNYILPEEVVGTYGADTLRFYMIGGTSAGLDLNYNFDDMKIKSRNLGVLWNLHNFLLEFMTQNSLTPEDLDETSCSMEENYMLSRLHSTIRKATEAMEAYRIHEVPGLVEQLFLDLSRTYVQMVREKSVLGTEEEKKAIAFTLWTTLLETLKMFCILCPFVSEKMYQDLRIGFALKPESVHLCGWPTKEERYVDAELEAKMELAFQIIQAALRGRESAKLGVRWPLSCAVLVTKDSNLREAVDSTQDIIRKATNIRQIVVQESLPGVTTRVRADYARLEPDFGNLAPKIIARIVGDSPESILSHIESEGKFAFSLEGQEISIRKEHLLIEHDVPKPYLELDTKHGKLYLNTELEAELLAEGFAREIMRRVQQMRKEAGLVKTDTILLDLEVGELKPALQAWEQSIRERVGAKTLTFRKMHDHYLATKTETIRDHPIGIFFDKS